MSTEPLRVVVYEDSGSLVAQCLEFDIRARAEDEEALRARFSALLALEADISTELNGSPFAGIDPAPKEFHDLWDACGGGESLSTPQAEVSMKMCA